MSSQTKQALAGEFLATLTGSKEVGLMIAKNKKELDDFARLMEEKGFKQSAGAFDFLKFLKTYFVADENMGKEIYDFAVQFPTGQVEIFDNKLMRSQTLSPNYDNSAVVLLVLKNDLDKLQAKGYNLLSSAGPAFQS